LYDKDSEEWQYRSQKAHDIFYENKITTGVICSVRTSDSGSGEILYGLSNLNPPCKESNPCVLEENIITEKIRETLKGY
jgi:hypothetical protein